MSFVTSWLFHGVDHAFLVSWIYTVQLQHHTIQKDPNIILAEFCNRLCDDMFSIPDYTMKIL